MTHTNPTRTALPVVLHVTLQVALQVALPLCLSTPALGQCGPTRLPTAGLPGVDGTVIDAVPWDPDGPGPLPTQTVVVGIFDHAGGVSCRNLARYDHTRREWAPIGGGTDASVHCAVAMPNGDLVVGGNFVHAGGVACAHIARWDGQSWSPLGTGTDGSVEALAVRPNGDLLAGGRFTTAGTIQARSLARWDGQSWSAVPGGVIAPSSAFVSRVTSFATMPNGDLVVGGWFTQIGSASIVGLARHDGATWSRFGAGINGGVESLVVLPNGDLVVGGNFGTAGGANAPALARWDGSAWTPYGTGLRQGSLIGTVNGIAPQPNGDLIVAGDFDTAGGAPASMVARWNGTSWHALGDGVVETSPFLARSAFCLLTLPDGKVLVGGTFEKVGEISTKGAAVWNGTQWLRPTDGCNGRVRRFAFGPAGELYAAGAFDAIGRPVARGVARWDGAAWSPLGAGSPLDVLALAVLTNGDVVVGGQPRFGESHVNVARWDGATWHEMPGLAGAVRALHVDRAGRLYAGGSMPGGIVRWVGNGWQPVGGGVAAGHQPADVREMIQLVNGDLVVSGLFTSAGSTAATSFARWDGTRWHSMATNASTGPAVSMCLLRDGRLAALGRFVIHNQTVPIAAWSGANWLPLSNWSGQSPGAGALAVLPGGQLLATDYSGAFGSHSLIRFDGSNWTAVEPVTGGVDAFAVLPDGTVAVGGGFLLLGGDFSPYIAMLRPTCPATATDLGGGCAGSHGPTVLTATELPWTGGAFEARGTGLAPISLAAAVYGLLPAATALGALLPQAAPGCTVRATADFTALRVGSNGELSTSLSIPRAASLVGVDVHHQLLAFALDANGGLVEVTASNALRARIGSW